jgi:hypothetical protein
MFQEFKLVLSKTEVSDLLEALTECLDDTQDSAKALLLKYVIIKLKGSKYYDKD